MKYDHIPRKRFGQNFLHDKNIIHKIGLAIAPKLGEHIVEIGPGLGALTYELLTMVPTVDVIEIDRDLAAHLQQQAEFSGKLTIHCTDALAFDFTTLHKQPLRIVGNLPYNISTPLIFHCLDNLTLITDMHFMLQKEVVERMCAAPDTPEYGRLSVMVQYYCQTKMLFTVGANAFTPKPKVESAIVRLIARPERTLSASQEHVFQKLVKQAFSQRRKTLRNVLRDLVTDAQFIKAQIDPQARAETLTMEQFVALTKTLEFAS
jgi:16S rRNA (adenine1518-N6/adenine1519-N6)-dimethyltransferase